MTTPNEELKKAGLKVTHPRMKILQLMEEMSGTSRHLSADDVYQLLRERDEDISLATIYRVLTQFEQAGIVERHNFESGQSVFEIADADHHDHMVCLKTGKVIEFHDEVIEQRQREIAAQHGWDITSHSLVIYGVSPEGKKNSGNK